MPNLKSLKPKLILIGASTGGPGQIIKILQSLKADFDATVIIAQHMGEEYLPSFAKNLNEKCLLNVCMVEDGMQLEVAQVYVCSGICTLMEDLVFSKQLTQADHFNPDINTIFESVVKLSDRFEVMSIILTGIGEDGAKGTFLLFHSGARCLAESEESAIVFGMPKRAIELCEDIEMKNIDEIIKNVQNF